MRVYDTEAGNLIVGETGFGERKRFRWFHEDGHYIGAVVTNNPIRHVYCSEDGLAVDTRQRRPRF